MHPPTRQRLGIAAFVLACAVVNGFSDPVQAQSTARNEARRAVLVELYTSQGCDYCPAAEKNLGMIAERTAGIVPIAFHVDYFNAPWRDPFSEKTYSQRQYAFNRLYTKPKNPDYGIYYTPMVMIDGVVSENGRDPKAIEASIKRALQKPPGVTLKTALTITPDNRNGTLEVRVSARNAQVAGQKLLVGAVLREDRVETKVESGENANKTLINRFGARKFLHKPLELSGKTEQTLEFLFVADPTWKVENLRLATFVQEETTGVVHQAIDQPWKTNTPKTAKN